MEHLIPQHTDKYKGCELIFLETCFFKAGKPKVVIKTDKEFCMIAVRNPEKLKLTSVKHEFAAIMRDRHKDTNGVFSLLYKK
jgi:hypothetical protein